MEVEDTPSLLERLSVDGWSVIVSASAEGITPLLSGLGPLIHAASRTDHHDLIPYEKHAAPPASMSALTGTEAQPMHTDGAYYHLPPRYVILQCLNPGEAYCPTRIWVMDLKQLRREGPAILMRPDWVAQGGGHPAFYCSVLDSERGAERIRFDPLCMRPALQAGQTADGVRTVLEHFSTRTEIEWERGSVLVIDNWRCLHARGAGAGDAPSRKLRRWLIGVNNGLVA
jgi:hypothetical protein